MGPYWDGGTMDAGGVPEISRWRKPPVTTQKATSPERAAESVLRHFHGPVRGLNAAWGWTRRDGLISNAPSGNTQCSSIKSFLAFYSVFLPLVVTEFFLR
jgi:hypothetical protein